MTEMVSLSTIIAAASLVNLGSFRKPIDWQKAFERSRSFTGKFTKIILDIAFPFLGSAARQSRSGRSERSRGSRR